jgi:hypothetical protein
MSENKALWKLCERQDGVVSYEQLIDNRLSRHAIAHRVKTGRLWPKHRGVYAVGRPQLSERGLWRAALLAVEAGAVLSHQTAAAVWGLRPTRGGDDIHVVVRSRSSLRDHDGVKVHRSSKLGSNHIGERLGLPVTTPGRTARDLALSLDERQIRALLREGEYRRVLDLGELRRSLGDDPSVEGRRLRRVLDEWVPGIGLTESELEVRFVELCAQARLPLPSPQSRLRGRKVDFYWADVMLAVEVDGYEAHRGRIAFQQDRSKDRALKAAGYEVLRFTWAEVVGKPRKVADEIDAARQRRRRQHAMEGRRYAGQDRHKVAR